MLQFSINLGKTCTILVEHDAFALRWRDIGMSMTSGVVLGGVDDMVWMGYDNGQGGMKHD